MNHRFQFVASAVVAVAACSFAGNQLSANTVNSGLALAVDAVVDVQQLHMELEITPVPERVPSTRLGHALASTKMSATVSLPFADQDAMERFANSVSDPHSPDFRKFITPEEVGQRFGLPAERQQAISDYLQTHGLSVTLMSKNRLSVMCEGTVAQFESAFNTTIDKYSIDPILAPIEPGGNTEFIAPSTVLKVPADIASDIIDVSGIETYTKPMPRTALTPTQTRGLYNAAPIYNGLQRGEGRTLAISNFDGFRLTNVPLYYSYYGLPTPAGGSNSNIHVVTIGGGLGTGTANGEGDLDIQMVLGMAPLCEFYIYDSNNDLVGALTREVNDNLADVISESYGWNLNSSTANSAHNQHLSMSAQGITYMCASGDSGTTLEPYSYPNYEPEVLMVGGTTATVTSGNVRSSEVGWSGSGGGWSTKAVTFNKLPSWQKGTGVPTTVNYRLCPDLALHASGGSTGAFPFYFNGSRTTSSIGTSFSSPVFAGMLGIGEQKMVGLGTLPANTAGKRRLGRIQDVIYAQDGRTDVWYDVISGSNGTLPAAVNGSTASSCKVKWDFVTGWGAMNIDAFVGTQAPVNDECTGAKTIVDGVIIFDTSGATNSALAIPSSCNAAGGTAINKDLWFKYTATCTGGGIASTCGDNFDTNIAVYDGASCPTASSIVVACNDNNNGCINNTSYVNFAATAGNSYYIRLGSPNTASGSGSLYMGCTANCPEDLDGDREVTASDIAFALLDFGACAGCPADLDGDGFVTNSDIALMLLSFGSCP